MSTADLLEQAVSRDLIAQALSHPDALWEIEFGRVVEKPMSALAVWIASRLQTLLDSEVRRLGLGHVVMEMVFILDATRDLSRRPDVAFVSKERWPLDRPLPYRGDWAVVPNLAVEIVSPHNEADQLARKRRQYFRYGVDEVWIIYPEERVVEVYDAHGIREYTPADRLTSRLLPGLEIDLAPLLPLVEPPAA